MSKPCCYVHDISRFFGREISTAILSILTLSCFLPAKLNAAVVSWTSIPFIITSIPEQLSEKTFKKRADVLVQPILTSKQSAVIDRDAPASEGWRIGALHRLAKGTSLFGVPMPDGKVYCAPIYGNAGNLFSCYKDSKSQGVFDFYWPYILSPYPGLPIFVELFDAAPKPISDPISYHVPNTPISSNFIYRLTLGVVREPGIDTERGYIVNVTPGIFAEKATSGAPILGQPPQHVGRDCKGRILFNGSIIDLLGIDEDGTIHYVVKKTMPEQTSSITYQEFTR